MTTINSILSVMLLGGSALSAQAEVLSVEKLTQLNKVHSVAVSSDGRQLVYGVKTPEGSDLYLQPLSAMSSSYTGSANLAKATRLTYDSSSETAVRFSSDGQAIYFLSSRSGSNQLWRLPLSGGEARPVTDLPVDIEGYTLSSDNQSVVLSLDVYPDCDTLACTIERDANPPAHNGQVYDSLMVRHWDH